MLPRCANSIYVKATTCLRHDNFYTPRFDFKYLALLLVFFCGLFCLAPSLNAAPKLTISAKTFSAGMAPFVDVLQDAGSTLTVEQVDSADYQNRFAPLLGSSLHFGYTQSAIWLRFKVLNATQLNDDYTLRFHPMTVDDISLFRYQTKLFSYPEDESVDYPRGVPGLLIPLGRLAPGEEAQYWVRVSSETALNLSLSIYSEAALARHLAIDTAKSSMTMGAMIALFIVALLIALIRRDAVFVFFAMSVLCLTGYLRAYFGYEPLFLPFMSTLPFEEFTFFVALSNVFLLGMMRRLLERDAILPGFSQAMRGMAILTLVTMFISPLLSAEASFYVFYGLNVAASLLRSAASLVAFLRVHRLDYLLMTVSFALSLFAIFSATLVSWLGGDLSSSVNANAGMPLAILLMTGLRLAALLMNFDVGRVALLRTEMSAHYKKLRLRDQSVLLSKLTHEIRTPMSGILGMNELLRETKLDETQDEYTLTIDRSGQELLTIIDDVTAFAHLQSNTLPIKNEAFNVADLVDNVMQNFSADASRKAVELISHVDPQVPLEVSGDVIRTKHILHNLLDYSLSHFRDGEVFLEVAYREECLVFSLQDCNQSLHDVQVEHLFTESDGLMGDISGVGLPLSRQIAQALGGSLTAHNKLAIGMSYQLILPVAPVNEDSAAEVFDTSLLRGKRLLVVDDSKTSCDVVKAQASSWGVKVDSCLSGSEGFAMLRAKANVGEAYDILVLDFAMPGMSGMQLAEKISEDDSLKKSELLIIMLTGLNIAPDKVKTEQLNIQRVVQKPMSSRALQMALLQDLSGVKEEPIEAGFGHVSILLAEDNEVSARVIQKMLERLGAVVKCVPDGEEALRCMQMESFDLVLMDCEMPVMDGFEATTLQRLWERDSGRARTPIVALTAHILEQMEGRIRESGMDSLLGKPVRLADLIAVIKRWVPKAKP